MDSAKGERLEVASGMDQFVGLIFLAAADEEIVLVKKKLTGRRAWHDGESGKGGRFFVRFEHFVEVDGAEDVDVVKEKRLVRVFFEKKPGGFSEAAACVEQKIVFA